MKKNGLIEYLLKLFSNSEKLREIVNNPTATQLVLLAEDEELVWKRAKEAADIEWNEEYNRQQKSDGTCPNCHATSDIVNKIKEVYGSGNVDGDVSGNLFGVYGSTHGSMRIDTNGVNHCNKCGNEWKKYKTNYVYKSDIMEKGLRYLANIIQDPIEYVWAKRFIKIFDGCYVETIVSLFKKNPTGLYSDTGEYLNTTKLKCYYKSIWDDLNIKRELQKLV